MGKEPGDLVPRFFIAFAINSFLEDSKSPDRQFRLISGGPSKVGGVVPGANHKMPSCAQKGTKSL